MAKRLESLAVVGIFVGALTACPDGRGGAPAAPSAQASVGSAPASNESCDEMVRREEAIVSAGSCDAKVERCVAVHARESWTRSIYCGGAQASLKADAAKAFEAIDTALVASGCRGAVWSSCPPKIP